MTNFEKWREELSIRDLINSTHGCYDCPLKNSCDKESDDCDMRIRVWANAEVEDE